MSVKRTWAISSLWLDPEPGVQLVSGGESRISSACYVNVLAQAMAAASFRHRGLATNAETKTGLVMGCAIEVGKGIIAYSNTQGEWSVRVKKATPLPLAVLPAVFAAPGSWEVVTAPTEAIPETPVAIEVDRKIQ
jgi:hypothetical protein